MIGYSSTKSVPMSTRVVALGRLAAVVVLVAMVAAACGSSGSSARPPGSNVIRTTTTRTPVTPTSLVTTTTRAPLTPTSRSTTTTDATTTTTTDATTTTTAATTTSEATTTTTEATTSTTSATTTTAPTSSTSAATTTTAPSSSSSTSATTYWLIALLGVLLVAAIVTAVLLAKRRRHAAWLEEVRGLLAEATDLRAATRAVVNAPGGHAVVELDRLASGASALNDRVVAATPQGDPAEQQALGALALATSGCARSLATLVQNLVPGQLPTPADVASVDAASTGLGAALDQLPPSLDALTHPPASPA